MNLAIIIGVSSYDHCNTLEACSNDVAIMKIVLEKLDKFDDICVISNSPKAYEAKQKITEFVNKYKSEEVNELVFYFSGHGARYDDDFFYVFSDFSEKRKEVSGLRNTELDGLIRNLNPDLTVKIVDACFSGSSYVKSENEIKPILEKSAKQNELSKLYFLHSSSSEEESLATEDYSFFSRSFFASLTQNIGKIRHRDIMAYVADDMGSNNLPKPTFIVQADNTEIFGEVDQDLIDYLQKSLGLSSDTEEGKSQEGPSHSSEESNFLTLIQAKTENEYCDQDTAFSNLEALKESYNSDQWPLELTELFRIESRLLEHHIPNEVEIGRWLAKQSEKYFQIPTFRTEKYSKQEYIERPKKPKSNRGLINRSIYSTGIAQYLDYAMDEEEYKLETVEKEHKVLSGLEFTAAAPYKAFQMIFNPKFGALEKYVLTIVPVYSRNKLEIFTAIEVLSYEDWESTSSPKCLGWKIESLGLKNLIEIKNRSKLSIASATAFIIQDIKSKVE